MRFFSNEAQDNVDDKTDRPTDPDTTAPVPQQRAGSPWQHDTEPAPRSTEVGTSGADDDDPDRTDRLPDSADRTVAFDDGAIRDHDTDGEPAPKHSLPDDTTPKHQLPDDSLAPNSLDTDKDKDKAEEDEADRDRIDGDKTDDDFKDEVRKDDATVDVALDDRGTFDDPHLTKDADTDTDTVIDDEPEPVVTPVTDTDTETETPVPVAVPVAETPSGTGAMPFFPSTDTQPLRDRWRDVQLRFVDDPKGATGDAAALVDEAVDKLSKALRDHRGSFAKGSDDTEALRVELRSYRDILDRLLGL